VREIGYSPGSAVSSWCEQEGNVDATDQFLPRRLPDHRFDEMLHWYQTVFDARIQFQDPVLAFLTYETNTTALPSPTLMCSSRMVT